MEELLKHYTEKIEQLKADYKIMEIYETVTEYNRLRDKEYRTEDENRQLAKANNKIASWNIHVKTMIDIYNSLMNKDKDLIIPSPVKYFIKGFSE